MHTVCTLVRLHMYAVEGRTYVTSLSVSRYGRTSQKTKTMAFLLYLLRTYVCIRRITDLAIHADRWVYIREYTVRSKGCTKSRIPAADLLLKMRFPFHPNGVKVRPIGRVMHAALCFVIGW